jgi:endonuclease/exonuclease/phosphatase family metal-dependent hydrolase
LAHDLWPEATNASMGSTLFARADLAVLDAGVITTLPKPQRSCWARLQFPSGAEVTVVSWHTPNRAGDGLIAKMAAYEAMTTWLAEAPRPIVLGADLNTWQDPVELVAAEPGEPHAAEFAFVGPDPAHRLTDGWRALLEARGALPAEGPLAVSKVLDGGASHRMDRIFFSDELVAHDGAYDLDGALEAGSDHALHWLTIGPRPTD